MPKPAKVRNPQLYKQMLAGLLQNTDTMDRAALAAQVVPVAGDIAGVANDVRNMATGRMDPTLGNMALAGAGALPLVPSGMGTIKRSMDEVGEAGSGLGLSDVADYINQHGFKAWTHKGRVYFKSPYTNADGTKGWATDTVTSFKEAREKLGY